jgi:hypothetical protein
MADVQKSVLYPGSVAALGRRRCARAEPAPPHAGCAAHAVSPAPSLAPIATPREKEETPMLCSALSRAFGLWRDRGFQGSPHLEVD